MVAAVGQTCFHQPSKTLQRVSGQSVSATVWTRSSPEFFPIRGKPSVHSLPQLSVSGPTSLYSGRGCKTLWKEFVSQSLWLMRWVVEDILNLGNTAVFAAVSENVLERMKLFWTLTQNWKCENVIKFFISGEVLGHSSPKLAGRML